MDLYLDLTLRNHSSPTSTCQPGKFRGVCKGAGLGLSSLKKNESPYPNILLTELKQIETLINYELLSQFRNPHL